MEKKFIPYNNIKLKFIMLAVLFIISSFFNLASAQPKTRIDNDSNIDFSKYNVSCYCEVNGTSPTQILKLDNNGDIVLQLINGKTEKEITVKYNQSQLELMKEFRLLKREDDIWKTNFPVLGETRTLKLRGEAKQTAEKLGALLKQDVVNLTKALSSLKREKNTYTILFSYVLDELVWRKFIKLGYMQERNITAGKPLWCGVVWAVYPPRKFSCGTNKISDKGISININWTDKAIKNMMPFVSDWKNLMKMFDDYIQFGFVKDAEVRKVFDRFNLYDASGRFTVPVIVESKDNTLYSDCDILSNRVAENMFKVFDLSDLTEEFSFSSDEEALVIFYHELMWELLDYYEREGIIKKPIAFSNPDESLPEDISDLVFIVRPQ
jgi:hypothetical protein